jgi:glutaminyl-tRNA synthetase
VANPESRSARDFIRAIVARDVSAGKNGGRVVTRFPPEPNGYLHIGHAAAIWLNFGIAAEYEGGRFHLRFDDTDPTKEEEEFVEAQKQDVRWLGCDWGEHLYFASDYFERMIGLAIELIKAGSAYVCDLSPEEIRAYRGSLTEPGRDSPYRSRGVEENLDLFARMRAGEFSEGSRVLRAKIDMASPNITLRDPVLYRIQFTPHHRTGDRWCIYPMYDYAHPISDAIEGITHSLCTLEFEDRRPLYDWVLDNVPIDCHPQQIAFARVNLSHTLMSKRVLRPLVEEGAVSGWDDPRMPTLCGMRRRGYPPEAIRRFCEEIGVAKRERTEEVARLEHHVREHLNRHAPRVLGVLRPLRLVIENWPEDRVEMLEAVNNPEDPSAGTRPLPFSRVLYIEQDDFREDPPRKFFRLAPGREVRLRYGYLITCTDVVKDERGEVTELRCTLDPATRGGHAPDGRRVRGTIHWVSAAHAIPAEIRLYDHLFSAPEPRAGEGETDVREHLNPRSLERLTACRVEPSLADASPGTRFQLERLGYFCVDPDSAPDRRILNRTVTLRDTWAKIERHDAKRREGAPGA